MAASVSFRTKIFQLALKTFLLMVGVGLIAIYCLYRFQNSDSENRTKEYLERNLFTQVQKLVPMFLLQEEWVATDLLLEQIRDEEELSYIAIIPNYSDLPYEFKNCKKNNSPSFCVLVNKEDIAVIAPIQEAGFDFGYLVKAKSRKGLFSSDQFIDMMYIVFIVLGAAIFVLTFTVLRYVNREGKGFLNKITNWLGLRIISLEKEVPPPPVFRINEMNELVQRVHELVIQYRQAAREQIVADIARQVAHDIRSPLAALEMASSAFKDGPQEQKILIRSACEEIRGILNVLKEQPQQGSEDIPLDESTLVRPILFLDVLESVVSEKRIEFRSEEAVELQLNICSQLNLNFIKVNRNHFRRLLSNIINNALEAYLPNSSKKIVKINAFVKNSWLCIEILDHGSGIPAALHQRIFERGVSFGKENGTGLGLFHAKKCIHSWGGQIEVESLSSQGTKFLLSLPLCATPAWFANELNFYSIKKVAILDDDPAIHMLWKERLRFLIEEKVLETMFHCHRASILKDWWISLPQHERREVLLLVDNDLHDDICNGPDLVEKLEGALNVYFVTSSFDQELLQDFCEKIGAKIVPKSLICSLPLNYENIAVQSQVILVDDNVITRKSWQLSALKKKIPFRSFSSPTEFKKFLHLISPDTLIYLDSDFGPQECRGEDFAKQLYEKGFKNLFLATGYDCADLEELTFIKGIVAKDPPWHSAESSDCF